MSSKDSILSILKEKKGAFVSGEDISAKLNISRTAVWKAIQALKEEGYSIEAVPHLGYKLVALTDLLLPSEIGERSFGSFGFEVRHMTQAGSTNEVAKGHAAEGAPEGTLVIAEVQTSGKGRSGRLWRSPKGGIWASLVVRPDIGVSEAVKFTPLTTLAVSRGIRALAGLEAMVKWPNDILISGRKVAGILTEMTAEVDRIDFLVIGIGINVNFSADELPEEVKGKATTLLDEVGRKVNRARLLREILGEMDRLYAGLKAGEFPAILEELKEVSATLGRTVTVLSGGEEIVGKALGFDEMGGLIIGLADGSLRVAYSGEIT